VLNGGVGDEEEDRGLPRLARAVTGALPGSVVRWAAARGAPMARLSGRTAMGANAMSQALTALTQPPRKLRLRTGDVGLEDIADRVGRDLDEVRRWSELGLLGTDLRQDAEGGDARWERSVFDRAALIDLALREGADEALLARAAAEDNLMWVALEKVLTGRAGMTGDQAAESAGVSFEFLTRIWQSLGLPTGELESPVFDRRDVAVLRTLGAVNVVFTEDDLAETASVVGRAMAEISTSLTDIFRRRIAEPFYEAGGTETDVVLRLSALRSMLVPTMAPVLEVALQRHLDSAIRSEIGARMEDLLEPGAGDRIMSVAFVDLVGFTAVSEQISPADVRNLAAKLLGAAETAVTRHGGRIVKSIGDAVMFTVSDPVRAAHAALDICEAVAANDDMPDVRAGIGHGPVLPGYADYFGRTVNLASRLCAAAKPREVVIHIDGDAPDDAAWAAAGLSVKPRKLKRLKGIGGDVRALRVTRDV
jgi:adenylate cyclase